MTTRSPEAKTLLSLPYWSRPYVKPYSIHPVVPLRFKLVKISIYSSTDCFQRCSLHFQGNCDCTSFRLRFKFRQLTTWRLDTIATMPALANKISSSQAPTACRGRHYKTYTSTTNMPEGNIRIFSGHCSAGLGGLAKPKQCPALYTVTFSFQVGLTSAQTTPQSAQSLFQGWN